jgi:plasmid stabilization system protein ParE
MDFKVLIADSAIADLEEIVDFVAQDNAEAAARLGEKLVERALSLAHMPQRFAFMTNVAESAKCRVRRFCFSIHATNPLAS